MRVFVVTDGEYSGYRIVACFSSRSAASQFIASHNAVHEGYRHITNDIEKYELFDTDPGYHERHWMTVELVGASLDAGFTEVKSPRTGSGIRQVMGPSRSARPNVGVSSAFFHPDDDYWRKEGLARHVTLCVSGEGDDRNVLKKAMQDRVLRVKAEPAVWWEHAKVPMGYVNDNVPVEERFIQADD